MEEQMTRMETIEGVTQYIPKQRQMKDDRSAQRRDKCVKTEQTRYGQIHDDADACGFDDDDDDEDDIMNNAIF